MFCHIFFKTLKIFKKRSNITPNKVFHNQVKITLRTKSQKKNVQTTRKKIGRTHRKKQKWKKGASWQGRRSGWWKEVDPRPGRPWGWAKETRECKSWYDLRTTNLPLRFCFGFWERKEEEVHRTSDWNENISFTTKGWFALIIAARSASTVEAIFFLNSILDPDQSKKETRGFNLTKNERERDFLGKQEGREEQKTWSWHEIPTVEEWLINKREGPSSTGGSREAVLVWGCLNYLKISDFDMTLIAYKSPVLVFVAK